jgi:hypothetical protein
MAPTETASVMCKASIRLRLVEYHRGPSWKGLIENCNQHRQTSKIIRGVQILEMLSYLGYPYLASSIFVRTLVGGVVAALN